jgi:hypothetical protein
MAEEEVKAADVETKQIEEKPETSTTSDVPNTEEVGEANGTTAEKDEIEAGVRDEGGTSNDQNGMTAHPHWPLMRQITSEALTTLINR